MNYLLLSFTHLDKWACLYIQLPVAFVIFYVILVCLYVRTSLIYKYLFSFPSFTFLVIIKPAVKQNFVFRILIALRRLYGRLWDMHTHDMCAYSQGQNVS